MSRLRTLPWPSVPVLVGSVALLAGAGLALWAHQLQQAADAQGRHLASQRHQRQQAAPSAPGPTDDQVLVAALPPAADGADRVAALLAQAAAQGVTVESIRQAEPLPMGSGQATLPAERITLQVRANGPYLALRQWVALALQHDDALLLERLRLSRPLATSTVLAADLGWSLLQAAPRAAR